MSEEVLEEKVVKAEDKEKSLKKKRVSRKKVCIFCADKNLEVDYKDVARLKKFVTEKGKIISRRQTGTCAKHQREITTAVKRARTMAYLPYVGD